ncbi:rhodanese-like domain-containing protein [Herbiconiux sp. CPCC 205763]|uniref:Rhodanese-like domain-containing protein n=1 Tax=Herbiconiux aconitum TaxID=2970913 RepID=A0ABT2GSK2_9MICO|nr:rhodanese-like domain-containing protein [Herbiconiux aconitum]MCS5718532.1 rhodanese-like domain-containing protein [Herbiconiux aconitum]
MTATDSPRLSPLLASPLVSTQWLADHLGSEGLVVLDASVLSISSPAGFGPANSWLSGLDEYLLAGHVPGAVFADLLEVFSDPAGSFGFARPSVERFEEAATSVGVDNDTTVVVYDTAAGQWAARVWWLFRAFGYDRVAVLDGGYAKWIAEERPVETGNVLPRSGAMFAAVERPGLWASKADVEAIVAGSTDAPATLVFAGPPSDFTGATSPRARAGHIPGSVSVPAGRLVDRSTKAFLKGDALREKLSPVLAGDRSRVVTYCGSGIAAASTALALTVLGEGSVAVYDGSLNEWSADPDAPLETTV